VERLVADRIEPEVARDGAHPLARDVDGGGARVGTAAVDLQENILARKTDRNRGFVAAIDDGGDHVLTTNRAGGPLAHLLADRRRELVSSDRTPPSVWLAACLQGCRRGRRAYRGEGPGGQVAHRVPARCAEIS